MTILNSYIIGSAPNYLKFVFYLLLGAVIVIIAYVFLVDKIFSLTKLKKSEIIGCIFSVVLITFTVCLEAFLLPTYLQDTRIPRIEATIDNTVSFIEVNNTYEFVEQKGSIYVFDVRKGTSEYDKLIAEGEQ